MGKFTQRRQFDQAQLVAEAVNGFDAFDPSIPDAAAVAELVEANGEY